MTHPDDRNSIWTNLPISRLITVLDAIDEERVKWDAKKTSLVGESCYGEFDFEEARYSLEEIFESTSQVSLKSADPQFIQTLMDELETELAAIVEKRKYGKAKKVNQKINSLKKLLL